MSNNFKIFITGANGQLAKSFSQIYPEKNLFLAGKNDLDVTSRREVMKKIKNEKPDIIFHFASLTRGDECTKNPKLAHKINVIGTKNIIDAAKSINSELVFVSTNEVFDGTKNAPYDEKDLPNPKTVVGRTKYKAEQLIKENLSKYYIIRTSWLYSNWSNNFIQAVFKKAREKYSIKLVSDEISSPTYSKDLAKAIKKLIKTKKYGVYHLSNSGKASRLEFAKFAFELKKLKGVKITPVNLSDFNRLSKPPLFSALNSEKAKELGISMRSWKSALKNFLLENDL